MAPLTQRASVTLMRKAHDRDLGVMEGQRIDRDVTLLRICPRNQPPSGAGFTGATP